MLYRRFLRTGVALGLGFLLSLASVVFAQPTTLAVYQELAIACATQIHDVPQTLAIRTSPEQPYLQHALTAHWVNLGRTVVVTDSSSSQVVPHVLEALTDRARVSYQRSGRRRITRTVHLDLRYRLVDGAGRVVAAGVCDEPYSDELARKNVSAVENEAYPETRAAVPAAGWFRRYLQPAAVVAATTVTVFLLFNLRSDRSNNPS